MKNLRVLFSALAFVVAIGAAFATDLLPVNNGYIMVTGPNPCNLSVTCSTSAGNDCENASHQPAFDGTTQSSTSCGTRLAKP